MLYFTFCVSFKFVFAWKKYVCLVDVSEHDCLYNSLGMVKVVCRNDQIQIQV